MLFMASYLSGIVAVILGEQGLMEFLFVFLFILVGTIILLFIDKKANQDYHYRLPGLEYFLAFLALRES